MIIAISWGLNVIAGLFWGFTYNRYPDYWSISENGMEFAFLIVLCAALWLSFVIIYHLGEIKGITSMKNTVLFRDYIDKRTDCLFTLRLRKHYTMRFPPRCGLIQKLTNG